MNPEILELDLTRPRVMAIVNVTPDSFYAGSRTFTAAEIERRAMTAADEGAYMLDVGGYSSRPGADDVSAKEEFSRVARALEVIRRRLPAMPVSVDTFRGEIVRRVVAEFGAVVVNDISAGGLDPAIVDAAAELQLPYIAMHMRGTPATMQRLTEYADVVGDVVDYFRLRLKELRGKGIRQIVLDPGFGFAKTLEQNYELLGGLHRLCGLGCPVLSALSRKSMIYKALDCTPAESLAGTVALGWESLRQGASMLRVHDVKEAADTVRIFEIFNRERND